MFLKSSWNVLEMFLNCSYFFFSKVCSHPVSVLKSLVTLVFWTASLQIAAEETNLPRSYRTALSQLRSSFCSSLHSYRERIGLLSSLLCPSCVVEPHTTVHVFFGSYPTSLTERDLWERSHLTSEFLFGISFFDLPPLPAPEPSPSNGQNRSGQSSSYTCHLFKYIAQMYMPLMIR